MNTASQALSRRFGPALLIAAAAFLSSVPVGAGAQAQLDGSILGAWTAPDRQSLNFSGSSVRHGPIACDEGRCQLTNPVPCKWSNLRDRLREANGDGICRIAESATTDSKAGVLRGFDERLRAESNRDRGFLASAKRNRLLLDSIKPTPLRHFVLNEFGDIYDLYFDGEHIFSLPSMGIGVTRFGRTR
jgi:hypothetical protein